MTKKTFCDICDKEITEFGGEYKYRGPQPVGFRTRYDLCEEHGIQALKFLHELREKKRKD